MCGDRLVVEKLLRSGANPDEPLPDNDAVGIRGRTPLMWATSRHYFDVMRLLLDSGANVNAKAQDGTTAAICTRVGTDKDLQALEMLCPYRPDLTIRDSRGRCMLDEARDRERFGGNKAMRQLLERYFPEALGRV
jgi:ankyrin repeat protein